jgi:DNA polymerase-3 subunit epsilon
VSLPGFITAIDFETTSINNPRATEIGLVALDLNLEPVATYETVINPGRPVNKRSLGVSRLSMEQINSAEPFSAYWPSIHPFINNRVLVAHNAEFDLKVLKAELETIGIKTLPPSICSCLLARKIYPKIPTHRLRFLASVLNIDLTPHRALSDALACGALLKNLISREPNAVNEKIEKAKTITETFPEPNKLLTLPLLRKTFETPFRNEDHAFETFKEIIASGKKQVALTGLPKIGKEAFAELLDSIGYFYKETTPGPRNTAFLVKSNVDFGERKIRHATEAGVPVLREEEFHHFVNLVKELGA